MYRICTKPQDLASVSVPGVQEVRHSLRDRCTGVRLPVERTGYCLDVVIGRAIGRLEVPLFLDDNPSITVMEIRAKARRIKARSGP